MDSGVIHHVFIIVLVFSDGNEEKGHIIFVVDVNEPTGPM